MGSSEYVVQAEQLTKSYGTNHVLKGIDLRVKRGTMLALLGPNGAGKTTTVKMLSTLLKPDGGTVTIEGFDVVKQADEVRRVIGLTGQSAAVDELLTGRENLVMMGRLYRLTSASAKARAQELLEDFDLVAAAERPVKTYSGGMRRRLDLAVSLIAAPPIIFLDEPTTGLDPRSRIAMWDIINDLKKKGATILLTTQYLEEADQLADRIIVIDGGKVIAEGTASELKATVGKDRLVVTLADAKSYAKAVKELDGDVVDSDEDDAAVTLVINDTSKDVKRILDRLDNVSTAIKSLSVHQPTLDDVFLQLTGKQKAEDTAKADEKAGE